MAKRTHHRRKTKKLNSSWNKILSRYLRAIFLSFFVGLVVFVAGKYFFKPSPPCANSLSCKSDLTEKIENGAVGIFHGRKVAAPPINLASDKTKSFVLGENVPTADKRIYVDLASQTLFAYQGNTLVLQTPISSGRWSKTPVGNFHIWEKLRSTRMSGGAGDDAYDLPNVPYVMYFYHDFGLHGAYWHDNFGHTMSHGCVNMRQVDAGAIFDWVDAPANGQLGTPVSVCNQFTQPNNCIQENPLTS